MLPQLCISCMEFASDRDQWWWYTAVFNVSKRSHSCSNGVWPYDSDGHRIPNFLSRQPVQWSLFRNFSSLFSSLIFQHISLWYISSLYIHRCLQRCTALLCKVASLGVWRIIFQWYTTSKWSAPVCMALATSHHSNLWMSEGGSEVLSACLPIGPFTDCWCQRALDKEIRVCISKGRWKQMENRDV